MWRSHRTVNMLIPLNNCKFVGEIIVIDNNMANQPFGLPTIDKLTILSNGENNYVNPSWNWGVSVAKYDNIALCNDDITFNPAIFELTPKPTELIGVGSYCYESKETNISLQHVTQRGHGFGCLMLFNKADYKPIPNKLRISFGDDWMFQHFATKSIITGLPIETEMSTTSRDAEFIAIAEQDSHIWHTLNK